MSTKLTYTGAEVQELLNKIEKGDFDNAKTLEGHPASYFAIASEFTSLAESFATELGRINTLYSYFNNGSANDALSLGGQLPSYYATATQYEILQRTLSDFKSLFDSMFEKDSEGNIHAKLSLWSSGGITAGGVGSGGSGGGGGISYNRLDSWSDYSADKSGWVLSALLGNNLNTRLISVENAGYITTSALAPYALRSEIPSLEGYFLASNFNQANLKSTLGISDWALASAKPTYTASEVGALGVNDTAADANKLGGYLSTTYLRASGQYSDSLNDLTSLGIYRMTGTLKDGPADASGYGNLMVVRSNSWDTLSQIFFNASNNRMFVRSGTNSNFTTRSWNTLAFTSDIPTKLSQLTDDVVAGKYLPLAGGTVNGSVYMNGYFRLGNSQPIMVADTNGVYQSALYLSTGNNFLIGYGTSVVGKRRTILLGNIIEFKSNGGEDNTLVLNADRTATFSSTVSALSFIGNLTGNAGSATYILTKLTSGDAFSPDKYKAYIQWVSGDTAVMKFTDGDYQFRANSATKLATPRTIWGQSFDGTGDITGPLHLGNNISIRCYSTSGSKISTLILDPSNTLLLGYDMSNIGGTVLYGKALAMRYGTSRTMGFLLNEYGNVAIGGATADEKLHVYGNGKFTGALTANSLTIGGVTLTYDSVNEALCINGNMYALGGITAGAAGISAYTSLESRVARLEQQLNIS